MLRIECRTCDHWRSLQNFCTRVSHGMPCVFDPVDRVRAEQRASRAVEEPLENPFGANTTQVGGDHYKKMGVQVWDVVDTWPLEQQIGYYRGGALKYLMRMGSKDARAQEIRKAEHYCRKLAEVLEAVRDEESAAEALGASAGSIE